MLVGSRMPAVASGVMENSGDLLPAVCGDCKCPLDDAMEFSGGRMRCSRCKVHAPPPTLPILTHQIATTVRCAPLKVGQHLARFGDTIRAIHLHLEDEHRLHFEKEHPKSGLSFNKDHLPFEEKQTLCIDLPSDAVAVGLSVRPKNLSLDPIEFSIQAHDGTAAIVTFDIYGDGNQAVLASRPGDIRRISLSTTDPASFLILSECIVYTTFSI